MNKRGLKSRTPSGNSVNTELFKELKNLASKTSIPMSKLLDKAIELLLKEYKHTL